MKKRSGRVRRLIVFSLSGLVVLCLAAAVASALGNLALPPPPTRLDRLEALDTARLVETLRLKRDLGEAVWPGWGTADIPVLLWNDEYSFLVGYADPPGDWELVAGDDFAGQPYHRRPTRNPQNFAVRVGERWVASMGTKWGADNFLISKFREAMPGPLKAVFPYRLLIQPTEVQMTGVLHESFHVYQAEVAPDHFGEADSVYGNGERYWAADAEMHAAWQSEIAALYQAVRADEPATMLASARAFLAARDRRRLDHQLEPALTNFERELEWLEGLAKYVELAIWREAAALGSTPLVSLTEDPDFKHYVTFEQRWSQELDQMKRQAALEGDVRFYYTGMAQAFVLDRLMPGWKTRALSEPIALEALLREAVQQP
jgi:hypothetical protein